MEHFEIFIAALFVSVAGLNVLARWLVGPVPDPARARRPRARARARDARRSSSSRTWSCWSSCRRCSTRRPSSPTCGRCATTSAPISMLSIGLVLATIGVVAVARARGDRPLLGDGLRARRDRLADRPGRGHGDHAPARRAAAARQRDRGREPGQRRDRARRLPGRRRGGGRRQLLAPWTRGSSSSAPRSGGIAIGLVVGYVVAEIRRRLDDTPTELTISLLTAYAAFIPADELGLSGVLAAVTAGVYLGWRAPELVSPADAAAGVRGVGDPRLPAQRDALHPDRAAAAGDRRRARGYAGRRGDRLLGARLRRGDRRPLRLAVHDALRDPGARPPPAAARAARRRGGQRIVVGWAGMRGAVSLAAALALPLETDAGRRSRIAT